MTFSVDKRSIFGELRIMRSVLLPPWSGWSRFLLTGVHQRWRSRPWSRAWVGVSAATGPHFWQTMIRSRWSRVRVGEMGRQVRGGSGRKRKKKEKEKGGEKNEKERKGKKMYNTKVQ